MELEIDEATLDAARTVFEEAFRHKPKSADWGFYSYDDGAPAMGGGVGAFTWFASFDQMMDAIVHHLPYFPLGPSTSDPAAVTSELAKVLKELGPSPSPAQLEAARVAANKALRHYSVISWWGTFESLLSGPGAFEKKIRAGFREDDDGSPIGPSELTDFRAYLSMYGM